MGIKTLILFWLGHRRAIEQIARSPSSLWIGLLFVLGAGLAREFDGEYLLREPWHVLIPLPVSIALSLLFFGQFRAGMKPDERYPGAWRSYLSFLRLFWMTAPLAFLYAVPYERFLSAAGSVTANLWTLAAVVAWRLLLMVRIARVLFNANHLAAACIVIFLGDVIALIALAHASLPLIDIMGGIRLSQSERVIADTALLVQLLGFLSLPLWIIGAAIAIATRHMRWQLPMGGSIAASAPLKALAGASVLVWVFVLPITQPEQRLRHEAERLLKQGDFAAGLAMMSAHQQHDFPPHWDPPPRPGYGETTPPLLDVLEAMLESSPAPWVRQRYIEKLAQRYLSSRYWEMDQATWDRVERLLAQLPEGPALAKQYDYEREMMRHGLEGTERPATQMAGEDQP